MTITVFSSYPFERPYLATAAQGQHAFNFLDAALTQDTAAQAAGSTAVAVFVNDDASAPVLEKLWALGVRYLLVRAAGTTTWTCPPPTGWACAWPMCPTTRLSPLPSTPWPSCWP
ncbi:hypothetical protein [Hymenobacter lapidarius]|uniref:hypothetical protein n=1 Tax=Hymenobacter lapidarius TaxID=1908237 RepID=UPI001EFB45B6|nr:hypothetical protein [Hymenobacter lapidarius]